MGHKGKQLLSENVKVEILGTIIKTGSQDNLKYVFKSTYSLAETRFTVYFCSCQSPLRKALVLDMDMDTSKGRQKPLKCTQADVEGHLEVQISSDNKGIQKLGPQRCSRFHLSKWTKPQVLQPNVFM